MSKFRIVRNEDMEMRRQAAEAHLIGYHANMDETFYKVAEVAREVVNDVMDAIERVQQYVPDSLEPDVAAGVCLTFVMSQLGDERRSALVDCSRANLHKVGLILLGR